MINTGHSSLKHAHSATPCTVFPNPICRQQGPACLAVACWPACRVLSVTVQHGRLAVLSIRHQGKTGLVSKFTGRQRRRLWAQVSRRWLT